MSKILGDVCKSSKQCDAGEVCDRKEKVCRASKRKAAVPKAVLAKECLRKGIPLVYERGAHKGERKTRDAIRRCTKQKDRNVHAYDAKTVKLLPPAPASAFTRPPMAKLNQMKKDNLVRLYKEGQKKGFVDPSKSTEGMTNKQLANAITRARHKKW